MKIAIISDIHDNLVNLEKCLTWCRDEKISNLICCGDIANSESLKFLSAEFTGQIFLVKGNAEIYDEKELEHYANINYFGKIGRFELANSNIGLCHEPYLIKKVQENGPCDFIFYGHTHKPWEEEKDKTRIVNPGTLGGVFFKATFAVYNSENGKLELKILEEL